MRPTVTEYELRHSLRQLRGAASSMSRAYTKYGRDNVLAFRSLKLLRAIHTCEAEACRLFGPARRRTKN